MKVGVVLLLVGMFLMAGVSAAMDPVPAYCEHQGYTFVSISSGGYEGYLLEKLQYYYSRESYLKFNDSLHKLDPSRREMLEVNKIVLGTVSTFGDINWSDREYYCVFDEENKCGGEEFFRGECGEEYKKDIACRKGGEVLFSQFEECCDGFESSNGWWNSGILGQPGCMEKANFFRKLWRWIF